MTESTHSESSKEMEFAVEDVIYTTIDAVQESLNKVSELVKIITAKMRGESCCPSDCKAKEGIGALLCLACIRRQGIKDYYDPKTQIEE